MGITDLMSAKRVCFNLKSSKKDEVIDELIKILCDDDKLYDSIEFKKAVLKREEEFSTGIGMGIAIPHGKDKSVKEPALTYGFSKNGIDYNSMDGEKAHMFFLISVPNNTDDVHLRILSSISRKLMHSEVREKLMKSTSYEDIINVLSD